ncbi:MAG TPA: prepilin-type N-terminal cleavage/methylation domain-containing protein [Anaerohalosphaeraceae bacterium]|nr:prepilin-type N-terminal cleavage/methylation domain-containing protein [Anaerohalosphaeraceae bacterium]HQG06519.1 prepilin-type N-terminal cleavage/methylation domain-containing protein [Anaerohalosphaeraceae bacterium]HQJ68283.1 prepilin-type N-terminal cleavage/methylation domain-containing protein [Anaerohalosphaeraceae bacterium]
MNSRFRDGFTLVEVLIVVLILGLLAAVVIISVNNASTEARQNSFVSCLRTFVSAAEYYRFKTGEYLGNAEPGQIPAGWDEYIEVKKWIRKTPIGGHWQTADQAASGFTSCIGVSFDGSDMTRDASFMEEIDAKIDDGNLSTGIFRQNGNAFYYILAL